MNDSVSAAIAAAQNAAANYVHQQQAVVPAAPAAPPAMAPVARPRSIADALASAGSAVDSWLGVNEYGIYVDKDKKTLFDKIEVDLKIPEVKFGFGVRYNIGSQVQYGKSWDGFREARSGQPWGAIIAEAQRIDPKCRGAYDLADIPATLIAPMIDSKTGKVKVEAGKRVGYTTSVTGYAIFMTYLAEAVRLFGEGGTVPTTISFGTKKGPTGDYGVLVYSVRQN